MFQVSDLIISRRYLGLINEFRALLGLHLLPEEEKKMSTCTVVHLALRRVFVSSILRVCAPRSTWGGGGGRNEKG